MAPTKNEIAASLAKIPAPDGRPLTDSGALSDIVVTDGKVFFSISVDAAAVPRWEPVRKAAEAAVRGMPGVQSVMVALTAERAPGRAPAGGDAPRRAGPGAGARGGPSSAQAPEGVKAIIAVASGKGGVGKSTVAANLAVALSKAGAKVGLLDADVYGPSIPLMMGQGAKPLVRGGKIVPLEAHGVKIMSIGFLLDPDKALIWRGPLVAQLITQFLNDVLWEDLDYLVIDLPPGTGDVQL
ncbi:MAG: P-loop NTPase, partial [Xanthobacteraceae bacterium]